MELKQIEEIVFYKNSKKIVDMVLVELTYRGCIVEVIKDKEHDMTTVLVFEKVK